jgi:phage shock protein PspC (stress-responsive transcriptional regulator)
MRSSTDKKLGGVCAGLADYFDMDPTLVRVLWILVVLCGGTGLLLYVILWIALPLAPAPVYAAPAPPASQVPLAPQS